MRKNRIHDIFIITDDLVLAMRREEILERVKEKVEKIPGYVDMTFLEGKLKENIEDYEREAETNGAAGGLMPFRNIGVWESLSKEVSMIIVFSSDTVVLGEERPVIMVDEENQIIGEFVNEERQNELKGKEGVHFLSDDFVIYSDLEVVGDPLFIMPELEFKYLEDIEGIKEVTAGSVSTLSDHFIRCRLGYEDTKHWTHLVGFNLQL